MGNLVRRGIDAYQKAARAQEAAEHTAEYAEKVKTATKTFGPPGPAAPQAAPAMIRTGGFAPEEPAGGDSKYRRIAKFLIVIGKENAAAILSELEPEHVEKISKEISAIRAVSPQEAAAVTIEFQAMFAALRKTGYLLPGAFSKGGVDTARKMLHAALGENKGEALLNKAVPESKEKQFDFLHGFTPKQLARLLKPESPQAQALVLARLPPKMSAAAINAMEPERKLEVLKRIARQKGVMPEVLEKVAAKLKENAGRMEKRDGDLEIDGMQRLAAILKSCDYALGDKIISAFEESRPDLGRHLREKLYTLEDIVSCLDRPLQEKLKEMSEREIAVLLRGRSKEFTDKIMGNVSDGRQKLIGEEIEILGSVPKRDSEAAAGALLAWFREKREEGSLILMTDEDVLK